MISFTLEHQDEKSLHALFYRAKAIVEIGGLIIYPTDTIYGLGASIYSEAGIRKIFRAKKRPMTAPLSVAVPSFSEISSIASVDDENLRGFLEEVFPSRITAILKRKEAVSALLTAGTDLIGVRIPDDPFSRELLEFTGPLTTTSVNLHGEPGDLCSGEIEGSGEMTSDVDIFVKSERLDDKLRKKSSSQGSTIIAFSKEKIEIIRRGDMKISEIMGIGAKWNFHL